MTLHDDVARGHVLTRREALALIGATGALLFTRSAGAILPTSDQRAAAPSTGAHPAPPGLCIARPAQTEGPYFVDEMLNRSDIRSDPSDGSVKPGALLQLDFNLSQIDTGVCTPLAGLYFDLWHTDHLGVYSDVQDPNFDTRGKKFLRGYQVSDSAGLVHFTTIYPGWYQGRTVHMHFKVRTAPEISPGFEFTSQLYFDDMLTDSVHAQQPYAVRGQRTLRNSGDGIYAQGGPQLVLPVTAITGGYAATFDLALENVVGVEPQTWTRMKRHFG